MFCCSESLRASWPNAFNELGFRSPAAFTVCDLCPLSRRFRPRFLWSQDFSCSPRLRSRKSQILHRTRQVA